MIVTCLFSHREVARLKGEGWRNKGERVEMMWAR